MKEVGSRIRHAREQQGLSIEDMHVRTKIRPKSIGAIEEGNFEAISGGNVYVKGFIRTLAEELGLDYNELIEMWEPVVIPPTIKKPRSGYRPSVFPFIGAVVMVLALVTAGVYYNLRPEPPSPPVTPPQVNIPPVVEEPEPTIPDVKPPAFVYV
ncbi:MAG: helix-turn-helix domain-containing protein, partial [Bacillota bacterium]|nr:helix-turn-helix domain-containing protein [Bacillota bacterium]